ncbi:hypothetical protein GCM10022200_01960 [Microbacterium awajiense]|uniref:Uncharacterized protein n=1 Tax=Microbacterium awajiense TaxID=415214 RepID=A0ABP7A1Y6_9MICO
MVGRVLVEDRAAVDGRARLEVGRQFVRELVAGHVVVEVVVVLGTGHRHTDVRGTAADERDAGGLDAAGVVEHTVLAGVLRQVVGSV